MIIKVEGSWEVGFHVAYISWFLATLGACAFEAYTTWSTFMCIKSHKWKSLDPQREYENAQHMLGNEKLIIEG